MDDLNPILSKITMPVAAIKSLRFALFILSIAFKDFYSAQTALTWYHLMTYPSEKLSLYSNGDTMLKCNFYPQVSWGEYIYI